VQRVGELYKQIGKVILRHRTGHKPPMSQQKLADAVGLSRASIVNIERGRHRIQIHVLYDIAIALGVDPPALLPRSGAGELAPPLPANFKKELNEKELIAVEHMLKPSNGDADV